MMTRRRKLLLALAVAVAWWAAVSLVANVRVPLLDALVASLALPALIVVIGLILSAWLADDPNVADLARRGDTQGLARALHFMGRDPVSSMHVRDAAAAALAGLRARDVLLAELDASRPAARVIRAVGQLEEGRAVPSLGRILGDPGADDARRAAAEALGSIGGTEAIESLVGALLAVDRSSIRESAADALVRIGAPAARPLALALRGRAELVREGLVAALESGSDPDRAVREAVGSLVARVEQDRATRVAAAAEAGVHSRGGLAEPYCSAACAAAATRFALADIIHLPCGACGSDVVRGSPASGRPGAPRDGAAVPFRGRMLVVCSLCKPARMEDFRTYRRCSMCDRPL
jgi:hypothetical protein